MDLHNPDNYLIHPKKQVLIPTQIKLGILPEYYGRIASKSQLAIQNQVHVGAGFIDPDYTGEIKVLLINNSKHNYQIKEGEPIAQLILEKASMPILKQVQKEVIEDVGPTAKEILIYMSLKSSHQRYPCKLNYYSFK